MVETLKQTGADCLECDDNEETIWSHRRHLVIVYLTLVSIAQTKSVTVINEMDKM